MFAAASADTGRRFTRKQDGADGEELPGTKGSGGCVKSPGADYWRRGRGPVPGAPQGPGSVGTGVCGRGQQVSERQEKV